MTYPIDQVSQVKKEKEEAQRLAKEAQDARYVKEGEASILRKTIEKVRFDPSPYIATLRYFILIS